MEKLLPIGKAAQYLGISTKTLRRWENQGRISPSRTQGNQRRYSLSDLEDLKALKEGSRLPISTEKPILSASEAAKKLGVSSRTMRRWEKEGDLPQALRTSGGHRRYSPRELKRFQIEAKARNHASQTPTAKPKYPPPGQPPYIPIRSAEEFRPRPKLSVRHLLLTTLVLITLASVVWANLPNLTKERVKRALIPGVENPIVDVNDALEYQGAEAFITGLKAKFPLETSSLVTEVLRVTNDAILNTSRFLGTVFFGSDSSYFISPTGDAVFNSVTSSKVDADILSSITIEVDKLNVEDLVVSGTSTGVTGTGGGGGIATGGDADTLEGQAGSYYLNWGNFTSTPAILSSLDGVSNNEGNIDLLAGSNITITPDDGANTITITSIAGSDADTLEGQTGSYYLSRSNHTGTQLSSTISDFDEASQDSVGGILTDTSTVDFTYNDALSQIAADVIPGGVDHGSLAGLGDDDHTIYLLASGTRALTGSWDAGSFEIRAQTFQSDVTTGTAPFIIASTTPVSNLNVDQLDSLDSLQFLRSDTTDSFTYGTLTLDAGTVLSIAGDLSIADTTIALTGGNTAFDLNAAASRTLTITNSDGTNVANLSVEGQVQVGNIAADPTALGAGSLYFNTGSSAFRCYNGAAWSDCAGTLYSTEDLALAPGDFITVAHNQATSDLLATGWYYDTANSQWRKIEDTSTTIKQALQNEFDDVPSGAKVRTETTLTTVQITQTVNVGTGADGAITVSSNKNINTDTMISGRSCTDGGDAVNYSVTALTANTATLSTIPQTGCLSVGEEVLLINLQGTTSSQVNVGNWETLRIASISTDTITFTTSKINYYGENSNDDTNIDTATSNQRVVLQRVPNYTNVTVNGGVDLDLNAWNGTKGGVLMFRATGTVSIGGTIRANNHGYRGGASQFQASAYQGESYNATGSVSTSNNLGAGGGGAGSGCTGGDCTGGGGGGGYGATGSNGGNGSSQPGGTGGAPYGSSDLGKLFTGSGGGGGGGAGSETGGAGGNAGAIIAIHADNLTVSGSITASGSNGAGAGGTRSGPGGGGSGGSVLLTGGTLSLGTNLITSAGGLGGNQGAGNQGGNGAVGRVAIYYASSLTGTANPSASSTATGFNTYGLYHSATIPTLNSTALDNLRWEANLPSNTKVSFQTRSGNSTDPTDGTWEDWKPFTVTTNYLLLESADTHTNWVETNVTVAEGDVIRNVDYFEDEDESDSTKLTKITSSTNGGYAEATPTGSPVNISGYDYITLWVRASQTGTVLRFGFGESAATEQTEDITIDTAGTWQKVYWDLSDVAGTARDAVTKLRITNLTTSSNTFYIDNIRAEKLMVTSVGIKITSTPQDYFQYRAILTTTNTNNIPRLENVALVYNNGYKVVQADTNNVRLYNFSGQTQQVKLNVTGAGFTNLANPWTDAGTYLYPTGYETLRVYDSGGTNYLNLSHDGTTGILGINGASTLYFDGSGRAGIGGVSTGRKFTVDVGGTQDGIDIIGTTSPELRLGDTGGATFSNMIYVTSDQTLRFGTSQVWDVLNIKNGNVGIGTTLPQGKLTVGSLDPGTGEATYKGLIQIQGNGDITSASNGLEFKAGSSGSGYGWLVTSPDRFSGNVPLSFAYRNNSAAWTELVTMRSDTGNVGIGTTGPVYELDVSKSEAGGLVGLRANNEDNTNAASHARVIAAVGGASAGDPLLLLDVAGTPGWHVGLDNSDSDKLMIGTGAVVDSSNVVTMTTGGNVGIGRTPATNDLEVEGTASKTAAGDWLANSDIRIKTDVQTIENALGVIDQLRPVRFKYTDEYIAQHPSLDSHYYYNFIAQEFQQVFPEAVKDSGDGYLQLDAYVVKPYLVAAVQELSSKIKTLEAQISAEGDLTQQNPDGSTTKIVTQTVEAEEGIFELLTATILGTFEKLVAKTAEIASAIIDKLTVTTLAIKGDATGQSTIKTGETKIVIQSSVITETSRVFTSPVTPTGGQMLIIGEKTAGESFEVYVESPASAGITFDWWVINSSK